MQPTPTLSHSIMVAVYSWYSSYSWLDRPYLREAEPRITPIERMERQGTVSRRVSGHATDIYAFSCHHGSCLFVVFVLFVVGPALPTRGRTTNHTNSTNGKARNGQPKGGRTCNRRPRVLIPSWWLLISGIRPIRGCKIPGISLPKTRDGIATLSPSEHFYSQLN
jgi:hypothetical protein